MNSKNAFFEELLGEMFIMSISTIIPMMMGRIFGVTSSEVIAEMGLMGAIFGLLLSVRLHNEFARSAKKELFLAKEARKRSIRQECSAIHANNEVSWITYHQIRTLRMCESDPEMEKYYY